jgi:aromatic ring-opening dioxygenase LigB subunit
MSGIVFGAVAPHGFPLIPDLSVDAEGALATRAALEELGRRCAAARPDVLVVASPHGTRVDGAICLAAVARAAGTLRWQNRQVELNVPVDLVLTDAIAETARAAQLPIALASYAGNRRDQSAISLDWGALVPLWFLGHGRNMVGHGDVLAPAPAHDAGPPVVLVGPSRLLPRAAMIAFGRAVADAADHTSRRVAFIASCDWAHTHSASGPYGFHPAAAQADALVLQALRAGDPGSLIDMDESLASDAAIDGLWQALMLAGVLERVPMRGELLSYEAPTYYGMLVASFTGQEVANSSIRAAT